LNTVISAVYYVKVMKVMILDERVEDVEGREPTALPERFPAVVFATVVALAVLLLGIVVNPVVAASQHGVDRFAPAGSPRVILKGRKAAPPLRSGRARPNGRNARESND
jgi:hypothetical protein